MPSSTSIRFSQSCPTCGRRVEVRSTLLGRTVACQHCTAQFVATTSNHHQMSDEQHNLMARVDRALELGGSSSVA